MDEVRRDGPEPDAPRPYDGLRILDLCHTLGAYCTRLFADLGAEVICVEPPGGRRDRARAPAIPGCPIGGVQFAFLNTGKKSVILDQTTPAGRAALDRLIGACAVVVAEPDDDPTPTRALVEHAAALPGARVVATVSYFGLTGPHAAHRGCDLIAQARGGIAWLSGLPHRAPLRLAGEQSMFVTSLYAATAIAACLTDVEARARTHVLDVSAQECIAHSLQNTLQRYDLENTVVKRGGEGGRDATEAIYRCADGYVFLASPLTIPASWHALIDWMVADVPAAMRLRDPDWQDQARRLDPAMHTEFRALFEAFAADKTKVQLRDQAVRRRVILSPVNVMADMQSDPQLVFRRYFQTVTPPGSAPLAFPGAPYFLTPPVWRVAGPPPEPGADTAAVLRAVGV